MSLFFPQGGFWVRMREATGPAGGSREGDGLAEKRGLRPCVSLVLAAPRDEDKKPVPLGACCPWGQAFSLQPPSHLLDPSGWHHCPHFTEADTALGEVKPLAGATRGMASGVGMPLQPPTLALWLRSHHVCPAQSIRAARVLGRLWC